MRGARIAAKSGGRSGVRVQSRLCREKKIEKNALENAANGKRAEFGAFLSILANFFVGKRLTS